MGNFDLFERHASENFSTALLVFSMKLSPRFGELVVRQIFENRFPTGASIEPVITVRVDEIEREYSIALPDSAQKRPDMIVRGLADRTDFVAIVEAKINADFGPTQLSDYRKWLCGEPQETKLLVVLTKRKYHWQNEYVRPDAELRWSELRSLISDVQLQPHSEFEERYWEQFRLHVEDTMRTFEGFKAESCNVHALMQDVDLFLQRLFEELQVTCTRGWRDYYAAYYAPELSSTIGFFWWRSDFWYEPQPNQFCVWKDGEKEPTPMRESLEEVARNTQDPATRDQYISDLAGRVLKLCGKGTTGVPAAVLPELDPM
jgi:hypothetical protein